MIRENRYLVLKRSDIEKYLSTADIDALDELVDIVDTCRVLAKKHTLDCVVVEHDWPEYDIVWKMIEDRVDKAKMP